MNVRVVVATHRDLEARVREEKFRQDLFHRIRHHRHGVVGNLEIDILQVVYAGAANDNAIG